MSLRKEGKARWTYGCSLCEYTSAPAPDQLRAEEAKLRHEETSQHIGNILAEAFKPAQEAITVLADAFMEMGRAVADNLMAAFAPLTEVFTPPQNVPHDPTRRGDKRIWGGK